MNHPTASGAAAHRGTSHQVPFSPGATDALSGIDAQPTIHNPKPSEGQVHPTARSLTLGPSNRQRDSVLLSSRSTAPFHFGKTQSPLRAVAFSHILLSRARYSSI
jgi:hypothetical protein